MPIRRARVVFVFLILTGTIVSVPACKPDTATRAPEISRRLSETPADVEIQVYRDEFRFEDDGTYVRTTTQRYEILTREGVENWGFTGAHYSPWYMDRPTLQAKVTSPGGQVTELDPKTIADNAAYPSAPDIYSDSRVLRAPLPNVTEGSIVEETITIRTTRPFFGNGTAHSVIFQSGIPRKQVELVIDVPEGSPLAFEVREAKVETQDRTADGRRRVTITGGPYPALELPEASLPYEVPTWPEVAFSTAESWQPLARAYAKIVDEKLTGFTVPPAAQPLVQSRAPAPEKATALLEWMRGSVRYTGIEFGESAIVPNPPVDVLGRGYGDCKDQALLLVGLLRAGGVDAKVALLDAGSGSDVMPERLPGLNVFNHAIVYVPGKEPFWIDPTADYTRAGELPLPDQHRLALVIDPSTKALTRTPDEKADANVYRERREVVLAEFEEARIVESGTSTGAIERQMRGNFRVAEKELRDSLTEYVGKAYNSKELGEWKNSAVTDISRPFEFSIEAKRAKVGYTDVFSAELILGYGVIFDWLPDPLWAKDPRRSEVFLPMAFKASTSYVVRPPDGFVPRDPPRFAEVDLAPLRLTRTATAGADGAVSVEFALEVPKRRLTTEEVEHIKKGLKKLGEEPEPRVHFVHRGSKLVEDRKLREGVEAFRELAKKNPKSAPHAMRFAQALLELGFGTQARRAAARAIELAPNDATLARLHATLLTHDEFGHHLDSGWDKDGAIAAYERARKLDPDNLQSPVQIAVLMEHGADGERYPLGLDLAKSLEVYDGLDPEKLRGYEEGRYVNNALVALMWAERWDELQARLGKLSFKEKPPVIAIVAAAATGGPAEGVSEATRLDLRGAARVQALEAAGDSLISLRRYPEAAALFDAASTDSERAVEMQRRARTVGKVRQVDPAKLPIKRPGDVMTKALAVTISSAKINDALLRPFFAERLVVEEEGSGLEDLAGSSVGARLRRVLGDTIASSLELKAEGDDKVGYRIKAKADFGGREMNFTAYVVKDRAGYRIRAWENQAHALGAEAIHWLDQKQPARAAQWLDWASDLYNKPQGSDPLGPGLYRRIWKDGKGDARLSAATLVALGPKPEQAIRLLEEARKKESDRDQRVFLERALIAAYDVKEDWKRAIEIVQGLQKEFPDSDVARDLELSLLASAGRWKEHRTRVTAALTKEPKDTTLRLLQILAETRNQNYVRARELGETFIADERPSAGFYNEQAWLALFLGDVREKDLEYALKSAQLDGNASNLHTLACVQIERGRLSDAWHTLQKIVEIRGDAGPSHEDYYVIGRLAELLELPQDAKAAYKKVEAPEKENPTSTFALAQKGLARLK